MMIDLEKLGLKVVGFWDSCFFCQDSKYSGVIVEDKNGERKTLSYFELNKIEKQNQQIKLEKLRKS